MKYVITIDSKKYKDLDGSIFRTDHAAQKVKEIIELYEDGVTKITIKVNNEKVTA
jgi:hypothetical protein